MPSSSIRHAGGVPTREDFQNSLLVLWILGPAENAWLKFHFARFGKLDWHRRTKNALLIHGMDRFHGLLLHRGLAEGLVARRFYNPRL
jgi:hypothetical protein